MPVYHAPLKGMSEYIKATKSLPLRSPWAHFEAQIIIIAPSQSGLFTGEKLIKFEISLAFAGQKMGLIF